MDTLPDLPLFEILIKLPLRDLKSICQSNQRLSNLADEYYWKTKILLETPIRYKYYPSWLLTYRHITSIPVFINIDNSNIFNPADINLYHDNNYRHIYCHYNKEPNMYINYYPGENFKTFISNIDSFVNQLTSTFIAIYFKDDILLRISVHPSCLNSTFQAGVIPNKILIFNDSHIINNIYSLCFMNSILTNDASEYYRKIAILFCKHIIQQYPNVNVYNLLNPNGDNNTIF